MVRTPTWSRDLAVARLRLLRVESRDLQPGQTVDFQLTGAVEDPVTWSWDYALR